MDIAGLVHERAVYPGDYIARRRETSPEGVDSGRLHRRRAREETAHAPLVDPGRRFCGLRPVGPHHPVVECPRNGSSAQIPAVEIVNEASDDRSTAEVAVRLSVALAPFGHSRPGPPAT